MFFRPWIRTPSSFSVRGCFPLGEYAVFLMEQYSIIGRAYIHTHTYIHTYTHTYMHASIYRYNIHTNKLHTYIHTMHVYVSKAISWICFFCRGIYLASIRLILKRRLLKWGLVYFLCKSHSRAPAHQKKNDNGVYKYTYNRIGANNKHRYTHTHARIKLHPTHKLYTHKHTQG